MKKILLTLSLILVIGITACSPSNNNTQNNTSKNDSYIDIFNNEDQLAALAIILENEINDWFEANEGKVNEWGDPIDWDPPSEERLFDDRFNRKITRNEYFLKQHPEFITSLNK